MMFAFVIGLTMFGAPDGSTDADRSAYDAAAAAAGRDADAQVKLALWCEAHGMPAERLKHLTRAVLLDPNNAKARGLLGQVQRDGKWMRADDVAKAVENSPQQSALMSEYLERRARTADKADDQYKLALWCEEKGLTQPMLAHLHRTLQLDPDREGAIRRLGFKKVGGRWVNPEVETAAKAEREAQAKSDKKWRPRLEKIRAELGSRDKVKRAEAEAELAAVADPRAASSVWQIFIRGGDEGRQRVGVDVLSRIDAPSASAALALIAVFSPHSAIRADAGRLLRGRDAREYASLLAGLLRDEIKYKVKPVEGVGSQGELFVEGRDANLRRRYTPLQVPGVAQTDFLGRDESGRLVAMRPTGRLYKGPTVGWADLNSGQVATFTPGFQGSTISNGAIHIPTGLAQNQALNSALGAAGLSADQAQGLVAKLPQETVYPVFRDTAGTGGRLEPFYEELLGIPIEQMMAEARASVLVARSQMQQDVDRIEAQNAPRREVNERALAVLKDVSGRDLGDDREKWLTWAVDLEGYAAPIRSASEPPATYVEDVPLAYQPQAVVQPTGTLIGFQVTHSCFAAGTMVRTLQGPRPIETIQAGDQVLAQDTTTGEFRFQAVETAYHNPPNETFRIALGGDEVVATGIHRFWKAGHGWVMTRDLKPGDRLRTVGGSTVVQAVEKDRVQPVFNLALVGGDAFCVGTQGVVAHDNSFVAPVHSPFDAVVDLASNGKR
ncbi:polymorphic toxin-type HINT domain-containing protein [Paludisphaera rhizosphaerae]|uniref:polymorphic toxin-type HINT domain-containing protein n=1 Tax=Paludisphaera rhizosphaerae TaxID=2711216 RepID=UPI0013EC6CC7|nr:polymorphic toxin-type HINT domain-containing protein [Paludisphaera rhizosphaerae]